MTAAPAETVYDLARRLHAAGVSCIPIRLDKPKAPALPSWEPYEARLPSPSELASWFKGYRRGIAAIGGSVSGGLECLDFDEPGLFERWADDLGQAAPDLLPRLVVVKTPKGGAHAWYRSDQCEGNQTLAARPPTEAEFRERPKLKSVKRIETRGAGGYALLPGCPAECHETGGLYAYSPLGLGDLAKVQRVTAAERDVMIGLCRAFTTFAEPVRGVGYRPDRADGGLPPWTDFDQRGPSWEAILAPHGWQLASGEWDSGRLTRPGKEIRHGWSATVGYCKGPAGEPRLYVWTTDGSGGLASGVYGKSAAWAILNHGGDFKASAKDLARQGFGDQTRPLGDGRSPAADVPAVAWAVKPAGDGPASGYSAADLVLQEFPPPRYAVDGLLCEGLNILGGKPKGGKSWLSLLISWAVAGGHVLDGRPVQAGPVLCLSLEDSFRRLQSRLRMLHPALGWEFPAGLDLRTSWPRADKGGLYHLAEWLTAHPDARLVVIDTIARFRRPGKGGGGNAYEDDYGAFGEIQQLALRFGVPILVITHTRKTKAEDIFDELTGTLGQNGAADGLMVLDRDRGSDGAKLYVTGRDVPEATVPLTLDRATFRWTLGPSSDRIDTLGRADKGAGSNKVEQCCVWLREFLKAYAFPSSEIVEAGKKAGFSFSAVRDAKTAMGRDGTGEVAARNFGSGRTANDWWNGLGPPDKWVLRPRGTSGESGRSNDNRPNSDKTSGHKNEGLSDEEIPFL